MSDDNDLIHGGGNAFRDSCDKDADVKQAKAILAAKIIGVLDDRKISVRKAEGMTGIGHTDFARVRGADLGRFTVDRLMKMLHALDDGIEVSIQFSARGAGADLNPLKPA